ncbi:MAG: lipoate--protein ligase family protein, partial [Leptolyngbya sp. SIO1D8]|nr:lipoate--protein ligase family protein [Leptolyngbya sp. SIO1D8]
MQQPWRFIPELVASGVTHMAIDTWLLDQLLSGKQRPTLRFYRWSPISISLGYHQKRWPSSWEELSWQGQPIELVKRPTGGRAVLHQGDFTYAIVMPMMGAHRQDLYKHICNALIAAWEGLGVALNYGTAGRGYRHQPSCFATATAADLVTDTGYKLIGSAQLRRDRCLLQQGTMRLWPDPVLYAQVFEETMHPAAIPASIPGQLSEGWLATLSHRVIAAVEKELGVTFEETPLTTHEQQCASATYA